MHKRRTYLFALILSILLASSPFAQQPKPEPVDPIEPEQNIMVDLKVVCFNAKWCIPCARMKPTIKLLVFEGVPLHEFDYEENKDLGTHFAVRVLPTVLFLYNGKPEAKFEGYQTYATLKRKFDELRRKYPPEPVPDSFPDTPVDIDDDDSGLPDIDKKPYDYRITEPTHVKASTHRNQNRRFHAARTRLRSLVGSH